MPHSARERQHAVMALAGGDRRDVIAEVSRVLGKQYEGKNLGGSIAAPALHAVRDAQAPGVVAASRDRSDSRAQTLDARRFGTRCRRTVAELSGVVPAPAFDSTGSRQRASVSRAGGDLGKALQGDPIASPLMASVARRVVSLKRS